MKNTLFPSVVASRQAPSLRRSAGFTLIELMVAVALFMVIGAAAFTLFKQHATLFSDQQNQGGLTLSLRNAMAQMQMDIVNAGTGYYQTANVSSWPIGVTVQNSAGGPACHTPGTQVYSAACFDTLNVVSPDPGTLPGQPTACTLTTTGAMTLTPPVGTTAAQLTAMAARYTKGSPVVFMHSALQGTQMTTAVLAADATLAGATVQITYGPTNADGTNGNGGATSANDPLGLTTKPDVDPVLLARTLTDQFCAGTDWVVKITATKYWVNAANANDPKLMRTEGGADNVLADQIIGFKVGASTVITNGAGAIVDNSATYSYNASNKPTDVPPGYQSQYDMIRSLRISLIGRTPPNQFAANNYKNGFDNGPYKIEAISVVVSPRNLSMND